MKKGFTSHTIVKDGMPFIGLVLRQIEPFMEEMLIDVSEKSSDGTMEELERFKKEYGDKVIITIERAKEFGDVVNARNRQVNNTKTTWMMLIDDDDFWCKDDLKKAIDYAYKHEEEIDGLSVSPYQMVDFKTYDASWIGKRQFSKFLKMQDGLYYKGNFPREMAYLPDRSLYYKFNPRIKRISINFYHLALMKYNSFRLKVGKEWVYKIKYPKQFK